MYARCIFLASILAVSGNYLCHCYLRSQARDVVPDRKPIVREEKVESILGEWFHGSVPYRLFVTDDGVVVIQNDDWPAKGVFDGKYLHLKYDYIPWHKKYHYIGKFELKEDRLVGWIVWTTSDNPFDELNVREENREIWTRKASDIIQCPPR